jgi:DNA-binding Lrp family transcriptional regulator
MARGREANDISDNGTGVDRVDRALLAELQRDATQSYANLGQAVGLSAGSAHERVRKLRERGVIERTTVAVDPEAVGLGVLAFVMLNQSAWMGDEATKESLAAIPEITEAHIVAGSADVLVKVRTASTKALQEVLRRIYEIAGVAGTQTIVVLTTAFERPISLEADELA